MPPNSIDLTGQIHPILKNLTPMSTQLFTGKTR